jgi:hypothetical protein
MLPEEVPGKHQFSDERGTRGVHFSFPVKRCGSSSRKYDVAAASLPRIFGGEAAASLNASLRMANLKDHEGLSGDSLAAAQAGHSARVCPAILSRPRKRAIRPGSVVLSRPRKRFFSLRPFRDGMTIARHFSGGKVANLI